MANLPLLGTRVLILEDDFWQADDGRAQLIDAGAEIVTMTGSIESAFASLVTRNLDIGLLDINLKGLHSFEVARALLGSGVPVLFLTGYESNVLPADLANVPLITKPINWIVVISQLTRMLGKPDQMAIDGGGPNSG